MGWNSPRPGFQRLSEGLQPLRDAAVKVLPANLLAFFWFEGEHSMMIFADGLGARAHRLGTYQLPDALQPRTSGLTRLTQEDLARNPEGLAENGLLRVGLPAGVHIPYGPLQVLILPLPGVDPCV